MQIDAHRDLRESYEESPYSHACAMRRLVERGAALIAIGIRSGAREEVAYANQHKRIRTFTAFDLVENPETESALVRLLGTLSGDVYLTIDVDGLEVHHCFGTGTPEPGGLSWWQTMRYLRTLLAGCGSTLRLVGADVVETVPVPGSQVNEYTAARLLAKIICFHGPAAL